MATTESDQILPPPPSIPTDGNKQDTKNKEDATSEPPRKRMKVDEPQMPHYNSHNMFARPQTGPSTNESQPLSLPIIHPPVTPLFDHDNDTQMNGNSNSKQQNQNEVESLIGAEVAALPEPQEVWPRCAYCDKGGDLSRCSSCRQAYYCNRECQVAHWEVHCIICQPGPPQPPSLPPQGQAVPQPTTFTSYYPQQRGGGGGRDQHNQYNGDQPSGYSQYNGGGGHPVQSQVNDYHHQPPQRPSRRRSHYNDNDDNINKEQYYCEECDRYFKNGQALGGHRSRVHSSRRNGGDQGADDPGGASSSRRRRSRPSRARHEPSGNGQYICPHCNREFATGNALGGHISGAHTKKSKRQAKQQQYDDHQRYARPRHPNI